MIRYFIIFLFPFLAIGQAGMFADFQEQASYEQANAGCTPDANELAITANAASDPNCNEANGFSGWTDVQSTKSSVTTDPQVGSYHLMFVSEEGNSDRVEYTFAIVNGGTYDITFDIKEISGDCRVSGWVGFSNGPSLNTVGNVWETKSYSVTANTTGTAIIRIYNNLSGGSVGDTFYLDNFSIIKTN